MKCYLLSIFLLRHVANGQTSLDKMRLIPDFQHAPFINGIASADPLRDSVLIWTRAADPFVTSIEWRFWEMNNAAQSFSKPLKSGTVSISADNDYTVTIQVTGLTQGTRYHYQFQDLKGRRSTLGSTLTIPDRADKVGVAVLSCTSLWAGFFNFYRHMASNDAVDVVMHLGDYHYVDVSYGYEYTRLPTELCPPDAGPTPVPKTNLSNGIPSFPYDFFYNLCNFTDRRALHSFVSSVYTLDPDYRAARANKPFIVFFDNEDIDDNHNYFTDGSRRSALDWYPMRHIVHPNGTITILRNFKWGGDLLEIIAMDTRTYEMNKVDNGLLGESQFEWMNGVLAKSKSMLWRVFGTAKTTMPFVLNFAQPFKKELVYLNANNDTWEGNPKDRDRLFDQLEANGVSDNNLWVTGDMHYCFISDVFRFNASTLDLLKYDPNKDTYKRYGGEFLPCSGTRGNLDETMYSYVNRLGPLSPIQYLVRPLTDSLTMAGNRHYRYYNGFDHGYGVATFTRTELTATIYLFPYLNVTDKFKTVTMYMPNKANKWSFSP